MAYEVPVVVVFSILIAMVLRGNFRGHTFFRAMFFFPVIIASGVCINILRSHVMMTNSSASVEQEAYMFSLPDFTVLTDLFGLPEFVVEFATKVVNGFFDITWKSGVQIILLLVAVNHISPSHYEVVVIIYTIIDSFTDYGNVIMRMIDDLRSEAFLSYATTIGLVYFVIVGVLIGVVTLIMNKLTKSAEY